MLSKRQKMTAKRGRASEEPTHSYDHDKFVNESAAENFGLISKMIRSGQVSVRNQQNL